MPVCLSVCEGGGRARAALSILPGWGMRGTASGGDTCPLQKSPRCWWGSSVVGLVVALLSQPSLTAVAPAATTAQAVVAFQEYLEDTLDMLHWAKSSLELGWAVLGLCVIPPTQCWEHPRVGVEGCQDLAAGCGARPCQTLTAKFRSWL